MVVVEEFSFQAKLCVYVLCSVAVRKMFGNVNLGSGSIPEWLCPKAAGLRGLEIGSGCFPDSLMVK